MLQRLSKLITASGMAAALTVGALPKPAAADQQSTINTILGAAAVVGGIILYNNYEHKRQAANTIVGYTRNGGTVYGDGRIVMPNGQTIYPNSNGQYPWGQGTYYNQNANGYTYDTARTGRYDTTHRHGNWNGQHGYVPVQQRVVPVARVNNWQNRNYNQARVSQYQASHTAMQRSVQHTMPVAHTTQVRNNQVRHDDHHDQHPH